MGGRENEGSSSYFPDEETEARDGKGLPLMVQPGSGAEV